MLGAWMMERTRSCFRSEHEASGAQVRGACERRCRTWDAVTVAWTAALRTLRRGDGAGARAVEAETVAALRRSSGGDGTGARGAGALFPRPRAADRGYNQHHGRQGSRRKHLARGQPDGDRFHDEAAVLTVAAVRHPCDCRGSRAPFVRFPGRH